jgi:hypothetical protein
MTAPAYQLINLNDSNPAAPAGARNSKWQQSAPYSKAVTVNGQEIETTATDVSAWKPNLGGVDARTTTSETIGAASEGMLVTLNNAGAIAVALDSTVPNYFLCAVQVIGAGAATFTPSTGTINGAASATIPGGSSQGSWLFFNGTNWWLLATGAGLSSGSGSILAPPYNYGPIWPMTSPPAAASLSWINQGSASAADSHGGLYITIPGSAGTNIRALVKALPTPPYTFRLAMFTTQSNIANWEWGIVVQDSGTGKLLICGLSNGIWKILGYTNPTTYGSYNPSSAAFLPGQMFIWLHDDGTFFSFGASSHPFDSGLYPLWTANRTNWLATPDHIGVCMDSENSVGMKGLVLDWDGV